jgi:hypothetical protein
MFVHELSLFAHASYFATLDIQVRTRYFLDQAHADPKIVRHPSLTHFDTFLLRQSCVSFILLSLYRLLFSLHYPPPRTVKTSPTGCRQKIPRTTNRTKKQNKETEQRNRTKKQNKETEEFLLKWISDKSRHISTYKSKSGKRLIWGGLTFNDTGLKTIKEYSAITKVAVEPKITNYLALPTTKKREATEPRSTEHGQHPPISRRETRDWLTQKSPSWSLAYMSTPKYVLARRASLPTTDI